ncbi:MAG: hypothetical protein ACYCY6_01755 [Minisyncoccota bacterium]
MELSSEKLADLVEERRMENPKESPKITVSEVLESNLDHGRKNPDFKKIRDKVNEILFSRKVKKGPMVHRRPKRNRIGSSLSRQRETSFDRHELQLPVHDR